MLIGRPHLHYRSIGSTNTEARRLADDGAGTGTLVTSNRQTEGRGREGRPWATPEGGLGYSFILRQAINVPGTLPLQVGVAVCEAVEALGAERAEVKWPNDVWIEGRKVAGILVEARPQDGWAVVGIGLNVFTTKEGFPPEVRSRAASVGHGASVTAAITTLNEHLGKRLDTNVDESLAEFSKRDALRGKLVTWHAGSGTAAGIDREGNLLVESRTGCLTALNAGEVHLDVTPD